jgi:cytochrome c peroxidase
MTTALRHSARRLQLPAAVAVFWLASGLALAADLPSPEALGEALFFDANLSANRTQSCSSCHSPDHAFADPRGTAASIGDDGTSLGDRNAPTAAYARFVPAFARRADGKWQGGLFHDGRAATLEDQAGGPPLNPIEMAMPGKAAVVARLKENPDYVKAFEALYGTGILDRPEDGYGAMTRAIAAFERTPQFAPFDSRYDRFLKGEITLTEEEELGRILFFSNQFTNCSQCHRLQQFAGAAEETFSDNLFHNIGVPVNTALRAENGVGSKRDEGLAANPAVAGAAAERGKFRTPTLRNVAVTGPYMHNGVFKDLRTVILFYNKFNSKAPKRQINPETSAAWAPPETDGTLSLTELESGPALKDREIDALVAFLKTLTDRRYEQQLTP